MRMRTWLLGAATLLFALQGFAEIKTYSADGDNSTTFPTDRRIYRGDCDANAPTPNAGDNADDQCICTPGVNCAKGLVPDAECAASGSEGRPNGGACDPSIPSGPGSCPTSFVEFIRNSPKPPCNKSDGGSIVINDTGNGTPTLQSMLLQTQWDDFVGASSVTGIAGSTVYLHTENTISIAPNQTGAGSTTTSINWGTLSGWTQTGRLLCQTTCPGGCGAASGCKPFVGFDGTGPPAPLKATTFNTDPWSFSGDGREFSATSFEIVSLGLGAVTAAAQIGGRQIQIPALPLAALGGLGAGLVYLGARALSRKRE